jgi:hypothetical protein
MNNAYVGADNDMQPDGPSCAERPSQDSVSGIRAVIYRRPSSPGRGEPQSSITTQREAYMRTVRELGFSLVDVYVEPDVRLRERRQGRVFWRVVAWFRRH